MVTQRRRLVAVLILMLGATITAASLTYSGFCMSGMRYVSDEEKIHNVVAGIVSNLIAAKDTPRRFVVRTDNRWVDYPESRIIPYESAEQFFRENENCCSVGMRPGESHSARRTFLRRLFGRVSDFVNVRYQLRFVDAEGVNRSMDVDAQIAIGACGVTYRGEY